MNQTDVFLNVRGFVKPNQDKMNKKSSLKTPHGRQASVPTVERYLSIGLQKKILEKQKHV